MDMIATSRTLKAELDWLEAAIAARIARHFGTGQAASPSPPRLSPKTCPLARTLRRAQVPPEGRLLLALALAPVLRPEALDPFLTRNPATDRVFSEFCLAARPEGGAQPSLGTAMFLLDTEGDRRAALEMLSADGALVAGGFLLPLRGLDAQGLHAPLELAPQFVGRILLGTRHRPEFRPDFPAKRLETQMRWEDLILPERTLHELEEVLAWTEHGAALAATAGIGRLILPGYRSLFYGPSGTGKTLSAALLGQRSGRDVYRVDLSLVVSKWIGETEKNLARVFDQAEAEGWILFFDEADSLFGKRTDVTQSNDRYANQEVSYILQRVEDFAGIVLLATNLRSNIDAAFARRFQSMIRFDLPDPAARLAIWRNAFPEAHLLAPEVDLVALAEEVALSGGEIVNTARTAHLTRLRAGAPTVTAASLRAAIARELHKAGKLAGAGP
ncbi:ATP-binding protein [Dinoroseobacter sp. PD6]|nr:ATP-binding protein [Dinoroseobacter sp. PD6]